MQDEADHPFEHVWDCQDVSLGHSPKLKMQNGQLKGLPNYHAQEAGNVAVTVCKECVHHVPGRMITMRTNELGDYFEIEDLDMLFRELPDGFSASGAARKRRRKLLEYSMTDPYNPGQNHAGKTLQYSYAFQKDRDGFKPEVKD